MLGQYNQNMNNKYVFPAGFCSHKVQTGQWEGGGGGMVEKPFLIFPSDVTLLVPDRTSVCDELGEKQSHCCFHR